MASFKPKWGPGEVQMYERMGTTTDFTKCGFCGTRGLEGTIVLLAYTVDGDLGGNQYACDSCADQAAPYNPRSTGSWSDDPRFSDRRKRR